MKNKISFYAICTTILMLALAACTPEGTIEIPFDTDTVADPIQTDEARDESLDSDDLLPDAVLKARSRLAADLEVPADSILIESYDQVDWPNSCLGLGGADETCLTAITPGWKVTLTAADETYDFRTDQTGDQVRREDHPEKDFGSLIGTEWRLLSFGIAENDTGTAPVLEGTELTLAFISENEVTGSAGCNKFFGKVGVDGTSLDIHDLTTTDISCAENIAEQEQQYLAAIQGAVYFLLSQDDQLHLFYEDGTRVLNFVPDAGEEPPALVQEEAPSLSDSEWQLIAITENGSDTIIEQDSNLRLLFGSDGTAAGFGGCNAFSLSFRVDGNALFFENFTQDLATCEDDSLMARETRFFEALQSVKTFEITAGTLVLRLGNQWALTFVPVQS